MQGHRYARISPFCDGGSARHDAAKLAEKIAAAKGIIVATPLYNYTVNSVFKNLMELTGKS